jgi:hypothetical protein
MRGGNLFILNSLIIPLDFNLNNEYLVRIAKIDVQKACEKLQKEKGFISAVGHESTASLLSELFKIKIPCNRITIRMKENDSAIHFFLRQRIQEGKVLSLDELKQLDYDIILSEVIEGK